MSFPSLCMLYFADHLELESLLRHIEKIWVVALREEISRSSPALYCVFHGKLLHWKMYIDLQIKFANLFVICFEACIQGCGLCCTSA